LIKMRDKILTTPQKRGGKPLEFQKK